MKRSFSLIGLAAVCLLGASCLQSDQTWVLNPDGSGKLNYDINIANPLGAGGQQEGVDTKELARGAARDILGKSKGIEAWGDVKYGMTDDGKTFFKGVAYFPDVSKVVIGDDTMNGVGVWEKLPDGKQRFSLSFSSGGEKKKDEDETPSADDAPKLTDEEIAAKVAEAKGAWQFMKAILEPMIGPIESKATMKLPGKIASVKGFKKESDTSASYKIGGKEIMKAMTDVMSDDKALTKIFKSGGNPLDLQGGGSPIDGNTLSKSIFGDGEPEIIFEPGEKQFDYKAEMEKAKNNPTVAFREIVAD